MAEVAIHMNGRVYDPQLGRFLSVDPVFQFPTNTQSLNPYTYVLNTPLSVTDPTGLMVEDAQTDGAELAQAKAPEKGGGEQEKSGREKREDRAEDRSKRRGASMSYYARSDTTDAERKAGKQDNGTRLADADRGQYARTPREGEPDRIGAPGTQVARAGAPDADLNAVFDLEGLDASLENFDVSAALAECGGCVVNTMMENAYFNGQIDSMQLQDFRQAQATGAAVGAAGVAVGFGGRAVVGGSAAAAKNLTFDGPSEGMKKHGEGRIAGVRWKGGKFGLRLDYHPLKGSGDSKILHINVGASEQMHIPLFDPRWFGGQ